MITTTSTGTSVTTNLHKQAGSDHRDDFWPTGNLDDDDNACRQLSYTYDDAGRPTGLTNPFSQAFSWSYYENNWLETQNHASIGYLVCLHPAEDSFQPDEQQDRPVSLSEYTGSTANPKMTYNAVGDYPLRDRQHSQCCRAYSVTDYSYQANRSQLLQETSTRNNSYSYDFVYDPAGIRQRSRGASKTYNAKNQNAAIRICL